MVLNGERLIKVGVWPPISSTSPKSPWKGTWSLRSDGRWWGVDGGGAAEIGCSF